MNKLAALLCSPRVERACGPAYRQLRRGIRRGYADRLRLEYPDLHDEVIETISRVRHATMTGPARVAAVCHAVEYIVRGQIPGAIVECGVWRGGSMMAAALTLRRLKTERELYLFDTFAGMTPPTSADTDLRGRPADERLGPHNYSHLRVTVDQVAANLASTGYPDFLNHYVCGPVEETLPENAPEQIALLRLDTDWYESTLHEMKTLFPRLAAGGVLIIDDYGDWQGARKAVDEYFANRAVFLSRIDFTGRLMVKGADLVLRSRGHDF